MLSGFFDYNNPVWRFIGKFWDVFLLSILWTICSIPIITIGASTTAMYYVTLKLVRDEDSYTIRSFFKAFKENFKQSTIIWLLFMVAGAMLGFDLFFVLKIYSGTMMVKSIMLAVFIALAFIYFAMLTYVFPLQARFINPVGKTIFNSFFIAIRHILQTLGIIAIDGIVTVLALTILPFLTLFGIALLAFINSYMIAGIFVKYMPKTQEEIMEN